MLFIEGKLFRDNTNIFLIYNFKNIDVYLHKIKKSVIKTK